MKAVLRLAWRGATFAGAIAMLYAANARALDNPAGTAPLASSSATAASATPAAAAAPAPAAAPQLPVSSVLKPGQWVVLPEAQPTASTRPSVAATPGLAAIPMPAPAATVAPRVAVAASVGGAAAVAPAGTSTPASSAGAKDQPTAGVIALRNTKDPSIVQNPYSWSVMVYKSQHRLVVYYRGRLYKDYHAVFGRNLDPGTKLWSGDRRTPEGAYTIIAKRLNSRWRYFLKLDYPNNADRARYEELVSQGEVPRFHGHAISPGDGIGIHGTDEPILNTGNVNWTTGCISVDNGAIDEIEALLPIGTLVVIKP